MTYQKWVGITINSSMLFKDTVNILKEEADYTSTIIGGGYILLNLRSLMELIIDNQEDIFLKREIKKQILELIEIMKKENAIIINIVEQS